MTGVFSSPLLNQPTALARIKKVLGAKGWTLSGRLLLLQNRKEASDRSEPKTIKTGADSLYRYFPNVTRPLYMLEKIGGLLIGEVREMRVTEWLGQANDVLYNTRMAEGVRRAYFICYSPRTESNLSITSSTESRSPFAGVPVSIAGPGSAASAPAAPGWFCVVDIVRRGEKRVQRCYGVIAMTDDLPPVRPPAGSTEAKASCTVYLWSNRSLSISACTLFLPLTSHVSSVEPRFRDFLPACVETTPLTTPRKVSWSLSFLYLPPPVSNLHPSSLPLFCLPRNVASTWYLWPRDMCRSFRYVLFCFLPKAKAKSKSVATSEENKKFLGRSQWLGGISPSMYYDW